MARKGFTWTWTKSETWHCPCSLYAALLYSSTPARASSSTSARQDHRYRQSLSLFSKDTDDTTLRVVFRGGTTGVISSQTAVLSGPSANDVPGTVVLDMAEPTPACSQKYSVELSWNALGRHAFIVVEALAQPSRAVTLVYVGPGHDECATTVDVPQSLHATNTERNQRRLFG